MPDNAEWEARVKGLLKAELKKRNVTYSQLVDRLADIGVRETEPNIDGPVKSWRMTAGCNGVFPTP